MEFERKTMDALFFKFFFFHCLFSFPHDMSILKTTGCLSRVAITTKRARRFERLLMAKIVYFN